MKKQFILTALTLAAAAVSASASIAREYITSLFKL